MKVCTIHQPDFLPYLGFFNKVQQADIFVLYDTAQYTKNGWHNRNRVRMDDRAEWLSIPVSVHLGDAIRDVRIVDQKYIKRHLLLLKQYYRNAPYFKEYYPFIEHIYQTYGEGKLVDLNIKLIQFVLESIAIKAEVVLASSLSLNPELKSTDALVDICKSVHAVEYISGAGGKTYIEEDKFIQNNITLRWQEFHHPEYEQGGAAFLSHLSVIDALFHVGPGVCNLVR